MASVTIGRFHNNIICFFNINRIFDQWLIYISNISGKYDFLSLIIFCHPYLNAARTKKMSGIYKAYLNTFSWFDSLIIRTSDKVTKNSHGIFHCICRNEFRFTFSSPLTVSPFRLKHLDMRAVTKHNIAKITCCFCCIDRSLISLGIQCRKIPGMIHMRMCQKYKIKISRSYRQILILIIIRSLLHTIIYQKFFPCCFQIITASGHFMRCTDKCYLHAQAPFCSSIYNSKYK